MNKKLHSSASCERILLANHSDIKFYVKNLQETIPSGPASESTFRYLVLDTFDWRLFRKKLQLRATKSGDVWLLQVYSNRDGTLQASAPVSALPSSVSELPVGSVRNQISRIVVPRALLPALEFQTKRLSLVARNNEDKVTATVNIDTNKVRTPRSRIWHQLEPCLEIVAVRGYDKAATQIRQTIQQQQETSISDADPIDRAIHLLDLLPMTEPNGKCLLLEPSQAALPAIAQCLQQLFIIMERNENGIISRVDTEFLHDFRIAIRRTRTVLRQLRAAFPGKLAPYEDKFAWLGELTGPARDSDVLILEIEKFREMLPTELHHALPSLKEFLQGKQYELYQPLIDALQSQDYKRFKTSWRRYLTRCSAQPAQIDEHTPLVNQVANKKIWKIYSQVLHQGEKIEKKSPASDYHRLRKTAKKLRYLLEFFQSLYASDDIRVLIKETKKLQDNLGEHQDLEVHTASFETYTKELQAQSDTSPDLLAALDRICRQMSKRKRRLRNEFQGRFDNFASKANKKHFKALFHQKGKIKSPK